MKPTPSDVEIRNNALEEAAKLVEGETCSDEKSCECFSCPMMNEIAKAIRSLKTNQ